MVGAVRRAAAAGARAAFRVRVCMGKLEQGSEGERRRESSSACSLSTKEEGGRRGEKRQGSHGDGMAPVLSTVATGKMAFLPKNPCLHFL